MFENVLKMFYKSGLNSIKFLVTHFLSMNEFLSKLSCSGPDLDKTKLTTEHNVVVDRSLCDNFCMGQTIHSGL